MAGAVVLVFSIGQLEKLVGYGIMLSMYFDADFLEFYSSWTPWNVYWHYKIAGMWNTVVELKQSRTRSYK